MSRPPRTSPTARADRARCAAAPDRPRQAGLSIFELMVAITIGMIILAGVSTLVVNQLTAANHNAKTLRLNQVLRAAMDLIVRDIRRAGHTCAYSNLIGATTGFTNTFTIADEGASATYRYEVCLADRTLDSTEISGFRVASGRLQKQHGGQWTDMTDGASVTIGSLSFCYEPAPANTCLTTPPSAAEIAATQGKIVVKNVRVTLVGSLPGDAPTSRSLQETVMLRNDEWVVP